MRITLFLAFSFATLLVNAQDQIIKKNGTSLDAKITEVGQWKISYKKFDNLDGPTYVVDKAEIYKIIFNDKTEETLGKYPTADAAKDFIISKINEFGIDEILLKYGDYFIKIRNLLRHSEWTAFENKKEILAKIEEVLDLIKQYLYKKNLHHE